MMGYSWLTKEEAKLISDCLNPAKIKTKIITKQEFYDKWLKTHDDYEGNVLWNKVEVNTISEDNVDHITLYDNGESFVYLNELNADDAKLISDYLNSPKEIIKNEN